MNGGQDEEASVVGPRSVISFIGGFAARSSRAQAPARQNSTVPSPTPCPQNNESSKLIKDEYVTRFNGQKLELDYQRGVLSGDILDGIEEAKVIPLAGSDLLVGFGDSVYRIHANRRVVWRHTTAWMAYDFAFVESTNLIYVTAGDNNLFILDAATGKEKHRESRNGSAAFGAAVTYGNDMCFVTDNNVGYREKFRGDGIDPMNDGITCWRGTKKLWTRDFPPDAELVVNGKRILAVTKSKKAIYVNEIVPPQTK